MSCSDLRIGGTLSGTGISGGVSINDTRIAVADWSGLFGHTGRALTPLRIDGRPGAQLVGSGVGLERYSTLNLLINRRNATGGFTEPTAGEQLWRNTDLLLAYLTDDFYLEVDDPDTSTRFALFTAKDPAGILQTEWRRITLPLVSEWPYWKAGGTQSSDTINGVDIMTIGGNVPIYDAVLVFSADGTFTHDDEGWSIQVSGSASAVTVDLGARTVLQAGVDASNLITRSHRDWGWFPTGVNNVTTNVSVGVTWRNQWQ